MFHDGPSKSRSVLYGRKCIGSIATFSADVFQYRRYLSSLSIVMADFLLKKKKKRYHHRKVTIYGSSSSKTTTTTVLQSVEHRANHISCPEMGCWRPVLPAGSPSLYIYIHSRLYIYKKKSGFLRLRIGLLLLLMLVKEIHSSTL